MGAEITNLKARTEELEMESALAQTNEKMAVASLEKTRMELQNTAHELDNKNRVVKVYKNALRGCKCDVHIKHMDNDDDSDDSMSGKGKEGVPNHPPNHFNHCIVNNVH